MKRLLAGLGTLLTIVAALSPGAAWALTDEEIFRDFRFNFINPGARSLGLGGAFIAAADDATAAVANPAALHYVFRNEVFVEYRFVDPDSVVFTPQAGTIGDLMNPDPFFLDLTSVNERDSTSFFSFASFATPFRIGSRRASVAVSAQVVLDVENNLTSDTEETALRFSNPDFPQWINDGTLGCASSSETGQIQFYSLCNTQTGELDTELINYNLSFSYSFVDDFSIGITATYADLSMTSEVLNTTDDPRGIFVSVNPRIDTGGGIFSDVLTRTTIDDTDGDITYSIGLHWHPDRSFPGGVSPIRFGLVYRKGAKLSVTEVIEEQDPATGVFVPTQAPFDNVLHVPDRFGLGFSYELGQHWTFAVDLERIEYSDLLDGYRSGINFFTSPDLGASFPQIAVSNLVFDVDDADVAHAGAEYASQTRGGWRYALRAGYYNAPDNRIRLVQVTSDDMNPEVEDLYRDVFRGDEDYNHFTGGVSLNTPGGFQIQLAGDWSDQGTQYVVSGIFRFGEVR